ncbi:MAG: ABC transporter permease [Pseudomonadota bacterium]
MHSLANLIVKELRSYLRDPRTRAILVGPPLLQLFVFSFAATLEVRNVDIAVLDDDAGRWSHELVARIAAADLVDDVKTVVSTEQLRALIDRREVLLGVRFPSDFSRAVEAGEGATAQVLIDGRRANAGQVAFSYLNSIAGGFGAELAQQATGQTAPAAAVRHWFNPNLEYRWFIVPSLSGMLSMMLALLVTALSIARERELGTFDQLLVTPAGPLEIIIGKTVPALVIGALVGSIMVAAGILFFRIPFTGSLALLMGCMLLFILSVVGLGLTISSFCKTQQQAILGVFAVTVPIVLISGFATPVENMPAWLQVVSEASPLKHFLLIVQGSFLKALPAAEVASHAWPLAVIATVTLVAATLVVKGRLQ